MRVDTDQSRDIKDLADSKKSIASHENSQESPSPLAPLRAMDGHNNSPDQQQNKKLLSNGMNTDMSKRSSRIRSSGIDGQDIQAQATEFSEQSSLMEAMLAFSANRKLQ